MPEPMGRQGRGSSFWEPTEQTDNPRLFKAKRSAQSALTQWLRGHHIGEKHWESDDEYGSGGYLVDAGTSIKPQPHRRKEDMEIVIFTINIKGSTC